MPTTLRKCDGPRCNSAYQDEKYGVAVRVFNKFLKGVRCTVCGTTKGDDAPAEKKEDTAAKVAKKK